jgi:hypothetical protein
LEKNFINSNKSLKNSLNVRHINKITKLPSLDSKLKIPDDKEPKEILPNSVRLLDEHNQDFWFALKNYLIYNNQSQGSINDKISYGKRYCHVLETKNAAELSILSPDKKSHAMKALAALSKFLGKYDTWVEMINKFQLKWPSNNKSIQVLKSIFDMENQGNNLDMMLKWIR